MEGTKMSLVCGGNCFGLNSSQKDEKLGKGKQKRKNEAGESNNVVVNVATKKIKLGSDVNLEETDIGPDHDKFYEVNQEDVATRNCSPVELSSNVMNMQVNGTVEVKGAIVEEIVKLKKAVMQINDTIEGLMNRTDQLDSKVSQKTLTEIGKTFLDDSLATEGRPGLPSERKTVLSKFGDVAKILLAQNVWKDEKYDVMMKLHLGYVDWASHWPILRKCRLVCKAWRNSVDDIVEKDTSNLSLLYDWLFCCPFVYQRKKYSPSPVVVKFDPRSNTEFRFGYRRKLEDFITSVRKHQMTDTMYNPIKTRHLEIELPQDCRLDTLDFAEWKSNSHDVLAFLNAVGNQIWHLTGPTLYDFDDSFPEIFHLESAWLNLLPNLKSLYLDISFGQRWETETKIKQFSLPHLKNLETIILLEPEPSFFVYELLRKNIHIKRLEITAGDTAHCDGLVTLVCDIGFPNLIELSIAISNEAQLIKLGYMPWAFTELSVFVYADFLTVGIPPVKKLFLYLEKFKTTLKFLRLDLSDAEADLRGLSLNLPNLQHLQIEMCFESKLTWKTFFIKFNCLETLKVTIGGVLGDSRDHEYILECVNEAVDKGNWSNHHKLKQVTMIAFNEEEDKGKPLRLRHYLERSGMPTLAVNLCIKSCLGKVMKSLNKCNGKFHPL